MGAPAVSIGNYKGVMLCNRPFAGAAAAAKAGAGLEVGGSGKAFLSGAVPKPHGSNVPIASREINPAVANREKKVTALHRHKQWLSELQGTKDDLEGKYLDHIAAKEDSKARFMEREARWRARVRSGLAAQGATFAATPASDDGGAAASSSAAAGGPEVSDDELVGGGAAAASAAPLAGDEDVLGEVAKLAAAERRRAKGGKQAPRPKWAMTEDAAALDDAAVEDEEADELVDFAEGLDFDKYMDDAEISSIMQHVRARIGELESEEKAAMLEEARDAADAEAKANRDPHALLTADMLEALDAANAAADAKDAKDDDAVSVAKSVMSDHKEVVGHVHSTKSVAAIASKAKEKLELVAEVAEEK